jgi:tetrapyrrole methylase family protein/MazG family protein
MDINLLVKAAEILNLQNVNQLVLIGLDEVRTRYALPFPPSLPVLLTGLDNQQAALEARLALCTAYPTNQPVSLVHTGLNPVRLEETTLSELESSVYLGTGSVLYLPPLAEDASLEAFQDVVAHLRAPEGCPWDREQTHATLRKHLLEESYEALDALDRNDLAGLAEELGDLLLQILLHSQIAWEAGNFSFVDVVQGINQKIIRRHPHVFGDVKAASVSRVLQNWEKLKEEERKARGEKVKGLLDGVPLSLPALSQAQEVQDRAKRVGFDWSEIAPVLAKVYEELDEVKSAPDAAARERELGDLLFAAVNLVRWYEVDAESVLRETTLRFRRRFTYIEQQARRHGRNLSDMSLEEMDVWWNEAKKLEKTE